MSTRRDFIKLAAFAGASLALGPRWLSRPKAARAFSRAELLSPSYAQSKNLQKFVQPLRGVGGTGIPIAQPDTVNPGWWQPGHPLHH
jgi:hypothetical protein